MNGPLPPEAAVSDRRGRFPFSLGAPSWVLPLEEDNFIGNVAWLAGRVDRVELLCLGKDHVDELLNPADVARLAALKAGGLDFSVHLPADLRLLDPPTAAGGLERRLDLLAHVLELTAPLEPLTLILHLDPAPACGDQLDRTLERILARLDDSQGSRAGISRCLLIENTGWDLVPFAPVLARHGLGVCADFGHLWHHGHSVAEFLTAFGPAIRELHLHGFSLAADHLALDETLDYPIDAASPLAPAVAFLDGRCPAVTIENFRADWLERSLSCLDRLIPATAPIRR